MNYVKDVCTKVLGLDCEDNRSSKFTIYITGENPIKHCYIDANGFLYDEASDLTVSVGDIIRGAVTFEKEREPVPIYDCPVGEYYCYVDELGYVIDTYNEGILFDLLCKKTHNMFKTDNLPQEQIDSVVNSLKGE